MTVHRKAPALVRHYFVSQHHLGRGPDRCAHPGCGLKRDDPIHLKTVKGT